MYTIYCHIFPNGKRYIGLTKSTLEKRWGNGENYKTCPLVSRAIKKYGWENISHVVLATAKALEEAEALERAMIEKFNTQNPEFGYNILPGGDVSNNHATEEMREKLGKGWRGKARSEAEKKRISDGVKRKFRSRKESNGHYGMKHTNETREKMSKSNLASWSGDEERRKKASERMKARMADPAYRKKVSDSLANSNKRRAGEWKMPDSGKEKISSYNKGKWLGEKSPCAKPVVQYTKEGVFVRRWACAKEAERAGIALGSNISACCNGKPHVKSVAGFVWRFEKDICNSAAEQRPF